MEEEGYMWADESSDFDHVEDKIDSMSPWELGFERGVAQAEEELFEGYDEE